MNQAEPSTLGARGPSASQAPAPPVGVFPPPPRGTRWQPIPASAIPAGIRLPLPRYVTADSTFVYARGVLAMPDGRAWMILRVYPRVGGLRDRVDHYYQAVGVNDWIAARSTLGAPPGEGGWKAWTGDLPAPVAIAFQNGRRQGQDFRVTIGSHPWVVRSDARGRATYTLGAPPFVRRVSVSAWRWDGPLPASRDRLISRRPLVPISFLGEPANPWPPMGDGWAETAPDEETRGELVAGLLGELPVNCYVDTMSKTGLWRFFAYETGAGQKAIGSLRYWGATLGDPSSLGDVPTDKAGFDNSIAIGDTALAAGNWGAAITAYQSAGNLGATTLGPEIDAQTAGASQPITQQAWGINTTLATLPTDSSATAQDAQAAQGLVQQMKGLYEQAIQAGGSPAQPPPAQGALTQAAIAMNNALLAHGYKRGDQPLYRAFQSAAGLSPDGFPGQATMNALFNALAAAGELPAPVKIYPWLRSGGFDGVNAPTWAEWTGGAPAPVPGGGGVTPPAPGGGGGVTPPAPKPTVTQAGMSTGGTVAAVLGTVLVIGGVAWAAATGHLPHWATPK
jgi:hypothetical protein